MSRFKQGDWVIFNDTGLESCYGQSHTLQHMKTLVLQITEVDPDSMTGDAEPTHLVQVDNEAINTFMLTDWDFDHYEGQEIGDSSGWDSDVKPIKSKPRTKLENDLLKEKAEAFNKVLLELISREAMLRDQVEKELARKQVRGTNPNQIIADDFYGGPLKKGEIKW